VTDFKEAATNLVRRALDPNMQFLVLRGIDDFARAGGDIDVLLPRGLASEALSRIAERADQDGWAIAGTSDIGYLLQICLVKRWGAEGEHQAVKVDLWNGLSWAALGRDPFGDALFRALVDEDESEIVGLTTLLQKLLYAGFLRERDRNRIFEACSTERVQAFTARNGVPLTRADLEAGRLDKISRWRLRAASAGISRAGLPVWALKVIWRTLRFRVFKSASSGSILVISGANPERRAALGTRFQNLLKLSGMRPPVIIKTVPDGRASSEPWSFVNLRVWWHAIRAETVIVEGASSDSSSKLLRAPVCVRLRGDAGAADPALQTAVGSESDLDLLLTLVSEQVINLIRETQKK